MSSPVEDGQLSVSPATVTVGIPTYNRSALLREALESVLAQTYSQFRLVISDNASTDDTADVVASYSDARLEYVRADRNIGMLGNFNRLIELADTDFLMLLADDDCIYPDYLRSVVHVLQRHRRVGLVHTAFDEIDIDSRVQRHAVSSMRARHPLTLEPGRQFLERSMTSLPLCFSTATYRTRAMREAGRMLPGEELFADIPLVMHIALGWDCAYIDKPLVGFRLHDATQTRQLSGQGGLEDEARDRQLAYIQAFLDRRTRFLDEAGLPNKMTSRYRALATIRFLVDRAGLGAPWLQTTGDFLRVVRLYPGILAHPLGVRFVVAQLGGRRLSRAVRDLRPPRRVVAQ
jgi:glycosyltransferase involved in cell wall biosynthesis